MQIILLETLNKLGNAGDTVSVKDGYAKNYLLPNKKAIVANKKNKDDLASKMEQINNNNQKKIAEANDYKANLDGKKISISMEANEDGNLYGNINHKIVLEEIQKILPINLNADSLILGSVKKVGLHEVIIRLYSDIEAKLEIEIIRKS